MTNRAGEAVVSTQAPAQGASLLKVASDVAAVLKAIIELSDDVKRGLSPLDSQGRLLRLQNSIQKNRPRVVKHIDQLCDMIDAERAKATGAA